MTSLNAHAEALFQMIKFLLGKLNFRNSRMNTISEMIYSAAKARGPCVLFSHTHRVAVQLISQIRAKRCTFRQCQKTRVEVMNNT